MSDEITIGSQNEEKVLGMIWVPDTDMFVFHVTLKLKTVDGQEFIITKLDEFLLISQNLVITRRIMLSNVSMIFDPIGLICSVTLVGKLLLQEIWCIGGIAWDDPLPIDQANRWGRYLISRRCWN